ncbi:MAG: hypothetical protein A2144_00815 [Chloroflexi bacterium RBG_16_50_9]|nr:MAG: hypothetical protein A2144_00815 [Chloroflexi bacterium RBG_16_50_9]
MEKLEKLFEPGNIGTLELKNRIIMAPIGGMSRVTEPGGYVTDEFISFYEARARGGVGFIQMSVRVFTAAQHSPGEQAPGLPVRAYRGPLYQGGLLSIEDDEHITSARRLTQAVHAHGVNLSFQITHYGVNLARQLLRRPPETRPELVRVVAPSAVRNPNSGWRPHALSIEEIREMVEAAGQAAGRGKAAGFDAVRIQGGHGYLVHQFLSPRTNTRTDEYGGSLENRCRFGCEITRRIREEVGPDFPIIFRMNGNDFLEGGVTPDQARQHAVLFVEAGADALDVSGGAIEARHWRIPTMYQPFGTLVNLAAAIKKEVKVPVITTGKISPPLGERILREGLADFIQMGRPLIADPELANKVREGRIEDICPCIWCNQCLDRPDLTGDPTRYCSVNPVVGREQEYKLEPVERAKKVMVIGGGPGGMEAARTLAERGHETSLYEKNDRLGGQWNIVSAHRPELGNLVRYLARGLEKSGVEVFLNREVTPQLVEDAKPNAVVVATGAIPSLPDVPGINGKNVVLATEVLSGKADTGQEVVIIGGRLVGLSTAVFLAGQGKQVSVVTRSGIGRGIVQTYKLAIMEILIKHYVRTYLNSTLDSITENGVNIVWDAGEPAVRGGDRYEILFLKADTVVIATGSKSERRLGERLSGFVPEVYMIGDCQEPRDVFAAIHEGSMVARKI